MTKGELRKLRKANRASGKPFDDGLSSDKDNGPVEFGPERLPNGKVNARRERALHRHAKFVYDFDRD